MQTWERDTGGRSPGHADNGTPSEVSTSHHTPSLHASAVLPCCPADSCAAVLPCWPAAALSCCPAAALPSSHFLRAIDTSHFVLLSALRVCTRPGARKASTRPPACCSRQLQDSAAPRHPQVASRTAGPHPCKAATSIAHYSSSQGNHARRIEGFGEFGVSKKFSDPRTFSEPIHTIRAR